MSKRLNGKALNGNARIPAPVVPAPSSRVDKGRKRSGLELPRKILHSGMALAVCATWLSHPRVPTILYNSALALVVIVTADLVRFRSDRFEKFYESVLGLFMREEEKETVNGVVYYLLGMLICLTFYPRDIACLSISILAICDTAASVFGRLFGKYTPRLPFSGTLFSPRKSLAGTLAACLFGFGTAWIFWTKLATLGDEGDLSWVPGRIGSTWKGIVEVERFARLPNPNSRMTAFGLSSLCGAVAGIAEAIDVYGLDDNLSLPVLFGFFLWCGMYIIG